MNSQTAATGVTTASAVTLDNSLVLLLACGAGLGVASLYYNQPMLKTLADEFRVGPTAIGRVPTLTQLGYAAGILLLSPIGDRIDRRKVILGKMLLLGVGLLAIAAAQSLVQLGALSVVVGLTASLAQDCVPAAAVLAPQASRGKTVGSVMTGLLLSSHRSSGRMRFMFDAGSARKMRVA